MKKLFHIRAFLAVILLCVFALAATPKRYLHDLVTNHNHSSAKKSDNRAAVDVAGFSCQYDQVVVTESFTFFSNEIAVNGPVQWLAVYSSNNYSFYPSYSILSLLLRGPPAFTA